MHTEPKANYGWQTADAPHSCGYLTGPVLAECQRLGVHRVLDLGCGNGALCQELARAGLEVVGCDADAGGIALAREAIPNVRFEAVSVYDPPSKLSEKPFDAVISTEVVEHLMAPRALPRFAASVLRPGGWFMVSTPYHGYLKNVLLSVAGKWDSHHSPLWDGGHVKFWSRATLTRLLEEEGFRVERFQGVGRLPWLWKSMLLTAQRK